MEAYINVDAKFDDSSEHRVDYLLTRFTNLLESEKNYEVKLQELWESFKSLDRGPTAYKVECLVKTYGPYLLCDKVEAVSSTHIRFSFTCGSDGMEFGRDFAYVMFTLGAINAECSFQHDEDLNSNEKEKYVFNRENIYKMK